MEGPEQDNSAKPGSKRQGSMRKGLDARHRSKRWIVMEQESANSVERAEAIQPAKQIRLLRRFAPGMTDKKKPGLAGPGFRLFGL
jgi:hypothetical protein